MPRRRALLRIGGNGGAAAGETAAVGGHSEGALCVPAQGGQARGAYAGGSPGNCYGGAGGSIGAVAAGDPAVASTFRPGSAGGGGGFYPGTGAGGGGGGGGALRIASSARIELESTGSLLANGGRGGDGANGNHGGGGGSRGVIARSPARCPLRP